MYGCSPRSLWLERRTDESCSCSIQGTSRLPQNHELLGLTFDLLPAGILPQRWWWSRVGSITSMSLFLKGSLWQISQLLSSSLSPGGSCLFLATNQILNELISSMNANITLCSHLIRRLCWLEKKVWIYVFIDPLQQLGCNHLRLGPLVKTLVEIKVSFPGQAASSVVTTQLFHTLTMNNTKAGR